MTVQITKKYGFFQMSREMLAKLLDSATLLCVPQITFEFGAPSQERASQILEYAEGYGLKVKIRCTDKEFPVKESFKGHDVEFIESQCSKLSCVKEAASLRAAKNLQLVLGKQEIDMLYITFQGYVSFKDWRCPVLGNIVDVDILDKIYNYIPCGNCGCLNLVSPVLLKKIIKNGT